MRNLKKFLALFLAMVMAMSLMLTANAAGFDGYSDKDDIDPAFSEAVEVLTGLKVLGGDEGGFRPKGDITRAEVAAVIYRIATGDVNDSQVKVYADYGNYVDVKPDAWYAGYVGYCTNAGYIKGEAGNRFNPSGKVTGYQALAMILRAVGYDKNHEFEGASWQVNVASLSKQLGVTQDVINSNFETTLNYAATREVVADLLFMTITTVPTVTYTTSLQYNDKETITSSKFNPTLGQKIFGLYVADEWISVDRWGRPGYRWMSGGRDIGTTTSANGGAYMVPAGHPIFGSGSSAVATIEAPYTVQYKDTQLECDVAADLGIPVEDYFDLYVNGDSNPNTAAIDPVVPNPNADPPIRSYHIVATDTVTKVGGQGRVTEFYDRVSSRWLTDPCSRCVMVDTMLAKVTNVTPAKLDQGDHVIVPAKLEVTIYDGGVSNAPAGNNGSSKRIISKPSTSKDNWEYGKGDMILINAWTNKGARTTQDELEAAAFQTDPVIGTDNPTTTLTQGVNAWVLQKSESFTGKQTTAYWNANKHQVDGKDYDDQLELFLDRAGQATNTTFTWWKDLYGNIIGITDAVASFGVITNIYAAISQGTSDTTGRVKAMATVKFADGHTDTVAIDKFLMSSVQAAFSETSTGFETSDAAVDAQGNRNITTVSNVQLTDSKNTVELWPVYDTVTNGPLTVSKLDPLPASKPADAANIGWLYLAPSAASNMQAHFFTGNPNDTYGILFSHMFQFVVASDNSVVAIEVAGGTDVDGTNGTADDRNTGLYADKYNNLAGETLGQEGKIFKNLSYMVLNNDDASVGGTFGTVNTVYLDNETQIMVYDGINTVITYNGVGALPGDVTLALGSEADWADTDGDGRANYVYVQGEIPGVVTYNLFYNNGGGAQWNGTTGTIAGYLNGKATTVTFNSYAMYNLVNNSASYDAHLFALQITNGVVSSVMYALNEESGGNWGQWILADYTVAGAPVDKSGTVLKFDDKTAPVQGVVNQISTDSTGAAGSEFKTGTANGNTYTVDTEAVYWHDSKDVDVANGLTNVAYERVSQGNRIVVSGATGAGGGTDNVEYWIAPSCDIIGELEWLNQRECDVTMVYEAGTINSVIQLYITSDPDVTPNETNNVVYGNRPYGSDVVITTTAPALVSTVTSGVRDTVVFGTTAPVAGTDPANAVVATMGAGANVQDLLFFPYSVNGNVTTNLTIRDQLGNLVYTETYDIVGGITGAPSADCHFYVINFKNAAANIFGSSVQGLPLKITNANGVQMTYTFEITTVNASGTVYLSTGTFGMN